MNKYLKKFSILLLTLMAFSPSVLAKEILLKDLDEEVTKIDENAGYMYVIGEYGFTSTHILTVKDVMIASRSITLDEEILEDNYIFDTDLAKDKLYNAVNIFTLSKNYSDNTWTVRKNFLGDKDFNSTLKDGKLSLKYINYQYIKEDTKVETTLEASTYNETLTSIFNYPGNDESLELNGTKLTGLIKKYEDVKYNEADPSENTGYYFAYVLKVEGANAKTTITSKTRLGKEKVIGYSSFDKTNQEPNNTGEIVLLIAIDPSDVVKEHKIYVDRDGEDPYYGPEEVVIDYSGVTFEKDSEASINLEVTDETDKKVIGDEWGYDFTANKEMNLTEPDEKNTMTLTGKLYKQNGVHAFGTETGYYFTFNITPSADSSLKNIKVTYPTGETTSSKILQGGESLAILYMVPEDKINNCSENCKFEIKVDLDNEQDEYREVTYYLDYNAVEFKAETKAIANITPKENAALKAEEEAGVLNLEGYIAEQDEDGYYINYKINLENATDEATVKVYDKTGEVTTAEVKDGVADVKYKIPVAEAIALALVSTVPENQFVIEIDADGEKNVYEPVTITINYEKVYTGAEGKIKYLAEQTGAAESLTIHNLADHWMQEYQKGDVNRKLTTYYAKASTPLVQSYSFSGKGNAYVEYEDYKKLEHHSDAYIDNFSRKVTFTEDGKTLNTQEEWKYSFYGYSSYGIMELTLLKNAQSATLKEEYNSKPELLNSEEDIQYYDVKLAVKDINEWLSNAYGDYGARKVVNDENSPVGDAETRNLVVGVDEKGYIRYLTNGEGWKEKNDSSEATTRKVEVVIDKIGTTKVLSPEELGITEVESKRREWQLDGKKDCREVDSNLPVVCVNLED